MCDEAAFAEIRESIDELRKTDAVQSEQIKTLFRTTEKQGASMFAIVKLLAVTVVGVLVIAVLALVFGALGERGFRAVTTAAPTALTVTQQPEVR